MWWKQTSVHLRIFFFYNKRIGSDNDSGTNSWWSYSLDILHGGEVFRCWVGFNLFRTRLAHSCPLIYFWMVRLKLSFFLTPILSCLIFLSKNVFSHLTSILYVFFFSLQIQTIEKYNGRLEWARWVPSDTHPALKNFSTRWRKKSNPKMTQTRARANES